jgi:hypothetical protein
VTTKSWTVCVADLSLTGLKVMAEGIAMKSPTVWLRLEVDRKRWNTTRSPRVAARNVHHANDPLDMTEKSRWFPVLDPRRLFYYSG